MSRTLDDLKLKPNERAALEELSARLRERFCDRLRKLVLFGSKARGDGDADSDIDVLVVVRDFDDLRESRELSHVLSRIDLRHGVFVQAVEYEEQQYEKEHRCEQPLLTSVERDGVPL